VTGRDSPQIWNAAANVLNIKFWRGNKNGLQALVLSRGRLSWLALILSNYYLKTYCINERWSKSKLKPGVCSKASLLLRCQLVLHFFIILKGELIKKTYKFTIENTNQ
jgi:hypothetical protein